MALAIARKKSALPRWASQKDGPMASGTEGPPIMGQMRHSMMASSSSQPTIRTFGGGRRSSASAMPDKKKGELPAVIGAKRPEPDPQTPPAATSASTAKLPGVDLQTQAFTIGRRHNLDFHEVHYALKELQKLPNNLPGGGMEKKDFETFLMRLFEVRHIPDGMLQVAYKEAKAESGPVDMDKFFQWYRDNMFTSVAAMTASADIQESNTLVDSLARKHNISAVDLDKIKKRFDTYDTDKSGEIEFDEFENMMGNLLGLSKPGDLPKERMDRFWKEIDKDGSGSVDFSEFTEWYLKYFSNGQFGGPLEAFYASYSPDVQRRNSATGEAGPAEASADGPSPGKNDEHAAALARLAGMGAGNPSALIDADQRRSLLRSEVRRRSTVE